MEVSFWQTTVINPLDSCHASGTKWEHVEGTIGERHPVMREIDRAIGRAMHEEWIGIMVSVRWPRYEVILRHHVLGRGLLVDPNLQKYLDNYPDSRPLTRYRDVSLTYITGNRLKDYVSGRVGMDTRTIYLTPPPDPAWGDAQ